MNRRNLANLTTKDLVERFTAIGVDQFQAELLGDTTKFTRLYWQKDAIENELKARAGDQRRTLLVLFDHSNVQVRLNAARATLAVAPYQARKMLQAIADSQEYPQAGDAGMSLWNLDRGVYKPT